MRVLWFSPTPSLYDEKKYGGWVASLESLVRKYCKEIKLGIAFEHTDPQFKVEKGNVVYYPIDQKNLVDKVLEKTDGKHSWKRLKSAYIRIIRDFKPDIIQCFGSEWPYGKLAGECSVPVVIHMQGFLNIYNESEQMTYSMLDLLFIRLFHPKTVFSLIFQRKRTKEINEFERSIMKCCHYFMGRTEWDKKIVKYYSPSAKYYYCPEAIRNNIYDSAYSWRYTENDMMKIITVTQAGALKGNEIILRTAKILKEQFGFQFEWRVAGRKENFAFFEKKTGIRHQDVNVELLGMIDAENVALELASATVYVHPAIIDNSPNSLCEAQLIGCPVVAANVGGIPQLVEDHVTGILYPYNEPHMLAFTLMELSRDRDRLQELSKWERSRAKERHNPEKIVSCIKEIYKDILDNEKVRK